MTMRDRDISASERLRELEQASEALNIADVIDRMYADKVGSRDGRARRVALLLYMVGRKGKTPTWAREQKVGPREFCVTNGELRRVIGGESIAFDFPIWLRVEGFVVDVGSLRYTDGREIPLRMFAWDAE